jgi:hypothetical protein
MPPNTVYVGRGSRWGNPDRVGHPGVPDRATAVERFRWRALRDGHFPYATLSRQRIRADLRGKNLACWCPLDEPCHADVLLEIANS